MGGSGATASAVETPDSGEDSGGDTN